jgi:hypothetical protein
MKSRAFLLVVVVLVASTLATPASADSTSLCQQLNAAPTGSTLTVPVGSHDIGDCLVDAGGWGNAPARTNVTVQGTDRTGVLITGSLRCVLCSGWTFRNLNLTGTINNKSTVLMSAGTGWDWRDSTISRSTGSPAMSAFNVDDWDAFGFWYSPTNWKLQDSLIENPSAPATDHEHYHAVYILGTRVSHQNSQVKNNVIRNTNGGSGVKVGWGSGAGGSWQNGYPGSVGVSISNNTFSDIHQASGNCGVLIAGFSVVSVSSNWFDCSTSTAAQPVSINDWPEYVPGGLARSAQVAGNHFKGARPTSNAQCARVPYPGASPIGGRLVLAGASYSWVGPMPWDYAMNSEFFALPLTGCDFNGITTTNNSIYN